MPGVHYEDGSSLPVRLAPLLSCRWISNCVGMRNQKYFMLFLLYVAIDETLAFIMTIRFVNARMDKFQVLLSPSLEGRCIGT